VAQVNPQTGVDTNSRILNYNDGNYTTYYRASPATVISVPCDCIDSVAILPGAPTINKLGVSVIAGVLSVEFLPGSSGTNPVINYAYSLNGTTGPFINFPIPQITSPLIITGLTSGVTYTIAIQAVSQDGNSASSNTATGTPL